MKTEAAMPAPVSAAPFSIEEGLATSPPTVTKQSATGAGSSAALGLISFGMTAMVLMFVRTTWVALEFRQFISCYALFQGGVGCLLAAIWSASKGNTFNATFFGTYGSFWLSWGAFFMMTLNGASWTPADADFETSQTLMNVQWGALSTLFLAVAVHCCGRVWCAGLALTAACYFLLAGGAWNAAVSEVGGYVGFAASVALIYAGSGEMMRDVSGVRWPGV